MYILSRGRPNRPHYGSCPSVCLFLPRAEKAQKEKPKLARTFPSAAAVSPVPRPYTQPRTHHTASYRPHCPDDHISPVVTSMMTSFSRRIIDCFCLMVVLWAP